MKVTDLKNNECIHCETEEQANAICKLMHEAGLKWNTGYSYLEKNRHSIYKSKTCYYPAEGKYADLDYYKESSYKIYKAEQFLTQEKQTMQTSKFKVLNSVIKINRETKEIQLEPQEGFEIDLEKSDLKNGKVLFKEVEKKYPSEFIYDFNRHGETKGMPLSQKYGYKLEILDTLLCLRDEYNRIDGFEEGYRFGENNWYVSNLKNKLDISCWSLPNGIMHFGKEETAKLFLNNFEEQLEQIKEFL